MSPPPVPLFVELCAGTAALSVRLAKAGGRPVISRMGAKTGYADRILEVAGLRPGQGADLYLWCEPDPGARLLLEAYRSRRLALEAAAIIRGWADEDPRALWTRLKAEGPARHEPDGRELARVARLLTSNRLINLDSQTWTNTGNGGSTFGGAEFCTSTDSLSTSLEAAPEVGEAVVQERALMPHEVARFGYLADTSYRRGFPDSGYDDEPARAETRGVPRHGAIRVGERFEALPEVIEAVITSSAVGPQPIPPGSIVYIDPPYVGTTGYAHDLPREQVVELARAWAEAGALVMISEAEPVAGLDGWHVVEITGDRRGQARTFSRQKREFVTMSAAPARPAQFFLFGAP